MIQQYDPEQHSRILRRYFGTAVIVPPEVITGKGGLIRAIWRFNRQPDAADYDTLHRIYEETGTRHTSGVEFQFIDDGGQPAIVYPE